MNRHRRRRQSSAFTASLLLFVTGAELLSATTASAYPGDVFENGNPVKAGPNTADPTQKVESGASVDESGAVQYSIPLPVAPNRQNMVPELSLRYSSRSPARGGIAQGWTLDLPVIELDTSRGVLRHKDYRSSLSKGNLIRVGDPDELIHAGLEYSEEYRAAEDGNHVKYVRYFTTQGTTKWRAYTTDGRIYDFGLTPESKDVPAASTSQGAGENRFFVTKISDRFGNEIQFNYAKVYANVADEYLSNQPVDIRVESIEYGKNTAANLSHHSRVVFEYNASLERCGESQVPIGAAFDYRSGFPLYKGASRLNRVRLDVANSGVWTERRSVALSYDMTELACNLTGKAHSPLRFLTSVTESAVAPDGTTTTMPPVMFTYGKRERTFDQRIDTTQIGRFGWGNTARSYGKGGGWPTINGMLLDLDGDGRLDVLSALRDASTPYDSPTVPPPDPYFCSAIWQRQTNSGFSAGAGFGATLTNPNTGVAVPNALPVMSWALPHRGTPTDGLDSRETCSLAAQYSRKRTNVPAEESCGTSGAYLSYRFMDVDADGLPDLVTAVDSNRGAYRPEDDAAVQPKSQFCFEPGACRDEAGNPTLCKVISSWSGYTPLIGNIPDDQTCPQGCWSPGCSGSEASCCSDIMDCNTEPLEVGNNWAPIVDEAPEAGLWDWPGDADDEMDRAYNGTWAANGFIGEEGGAPQGNVNLKCLQWPEIYCGHYMVRVYKNLGGGQFSGSPQLVAAPVPLETDRPTSPLGAGMFAGASSWHGFGDLDGDGVPDAIHMEPFWYGPDNDWPTAPNHFSVFPGTGDGNFASHPAGGGYSWSSPRLGMNANPTTHFGRARVHVRDVDSTSGIHKTQEATGMHDMNGDGLPDYVDRRAWFGESEIVAMRVFFNTGRGFQSNDAWPGFAGNLFGPKWQNKVSVLDRSMDWSALRYTDGHLRRGYSRSTHRLVDVDEDGLVDLVVMPDVSGEMNNPWGSWGNSPVKIYLNTGDRFAYAGSNASWNKVRTALARITMNALGDWEVATDFVDLDGDGLPEAITGEAGGADCAFNAAGTVSGLCYTDDGWTDSAASGPMRALKSVSNGKGAVVTFDYAASRPTSGRVPHPVWVVSKMTTSAGTDALGASIPSSITSYAYDLPAYNKDFEGRWGFRGFGKATITGPSGAKVITTKSFNSYYGGLVTDVRTVEAGGHVASIEQRTWTQKSVFDTDVHPGTVRTQHMTAKDTRTCGAAQTESQCASSGALRHDEYTLFALVTATNSTPLGYYPYQVVSGPSAGPVTGAVYSAYWDQLYIAPGKYWITRLSEWSGRYTSYGVYETATQTSHYYDTSKTVELWTSRYIGAAEGWATTSHVYDMATGNKVIERSPKHFGLQKGTVFGYDAQKRFVTQVTNELGHTVVAVIDPATGTALEERGPNAKNGVLDGVIRTIDGFGRVKTESEMIDDGSGYAPVQLLDISYLDTPTPHTKVITQRRIEFNENRWTHEELEMDGVGRPITTSSFDGTTLIARTSTFRDAAGHAVRVRAPRPDAVLATDTIDWTYGYDSIGRLVATAEPARAGCTEYTPSSLSWCGQRLIYDGRTNQREDVTGTLAGTERGTPGKTRVTRNALGQTTLVEEWTSAGTWAPTTYTFEGHGSVASVLNADGVLTSLAYDLLGRRKGVTRGGQTWSVEYDLNGNVTKIHAPVEPGGSAESGAVTLTYDDLDREITRTAGAGNIPAQDVAALGTGNTVRAYDFGANGKGRLSNVAWSHGTTAFEYDSRGNVKSIADTFSILGGTFSDSRTRQRTYNALGLLRSAVNADGTVFSHTYDNRGLGGTLSWSGDSSGPALQLTYSVAGKVLERWKPSSSGIRVRETFGYDTVGRIRDLWIGSRLPGTNAVTTRSQESFFFDATGMVYRMDSTLAATGSGSSNSAAYGYDAQHRLVSATGPHGYTGTFSYSPGGRITSAQVAADATASRVHARNVTYAYGADTPGSGADPDAPVTLTSPGGVTWLAMDYDVAGNMLTRDIGATSFEHFYDGGNRQRAVTAPDGGHDLYWYDGTGERALVATKNGAGAIERVRWNLGDTEIWYDAAGTPESKFAYSSLDGHGIRIVDSQTVEHLFKDPRGHLLAAIGENGSLRGGFRYGPYGELLDEVGGASDELLRRFNGKEYDDTSGLSYYGHRYYDERTLAWTQADPYYLFSPDAAVRSPRSAALYSFSRYNPISNVDPNGLDDHPVNGSAGNAGGSSAGSPSSSPASDPERDLEDWMERCEAKDPECNTYEIVDTAPWVTNWVDTGDMVLAEINNQNYLIWKSTHQWTKISYLRAAELDSVMRLNSGNPEKRDQFYADIQAAGDAYFGLFRVLARFLPGGELADKVADALYGDPLERGAPNMDPPGGRGSTRGEASATNYKVPVKGSGRTRKNDVPTWAQGERPYVDETGNEFATRLMNAKYGAGNWENRRNRGPGSEFNQLKKYGNEGFVNP